MKPIIITDTANSTQYTLEYNRESVKFAEDRGVKLNDLANGDVGISNLEMLFFAAFRMHHRNVSLEKAMHILYDDLGGLPQNMLPRLIDLYSEPYNALLSGSDEAKNPQIKVEL